MNLLISTALFYPSRLGGPANTLYWLSNALVKNGARVSVVTTDRYIETGKVKIDTWSDVNGIKVRYCKSGRSCFFKELWYTWKGMRNFDTVMLCDMFQNQVLPVAFMARIRRKKIIWSPRGELFGPALDGSKVKRCYIGLVSKCFGHYATFHATSNEEKESIRDHIGKDAKVVVIPNYIELPKQLERDITTMPYFLYLGRVNRIKALDRLLLGLFHSRLFRQSDYILKIAGPNQDNYQQELERIIEENEMQGRVVFIGNVFGQAKFKLYANAYFSCLLSHSENFGNVVIEALSQGTPVIASTGTPWQVLSDSNAGFWIDNSEESICKCVEEALSLSEEAYLSMRCSARQLANSFDVSQNINNWMEII